MLVTKGRWIFLSLGVFTLALAACVQVEPQMLVQATATEVPQVADTPTPVSTETPAPTPEEVMEAPAAEENAARVQVITAQDQPHQGQIVFENSCAHCHHPGSLGGELTASRLVRFDTAQGVFDFVSENMPRFAPGSLSPNEYWNVTAFLVLSSGLVPSDQQVGPNIAENISLEADRIQVGLAEYEINMPSSISAGLTLFEVTNTGTKEHNFRIEGQGMEREFEENLQPGETQAMGVDLEPGTYEVDCPIANDAESGMQLQLIVIE
jgi:mono/diheme cytochrome c family protein